MTTTSVRGRPVVDHDAGRPSGPPLRLRLFAICAALATLVFSQSSGMVSADTKIDLLVDPLRLLSRSLSLWDPNGASGQLQNQAYGYLFPIGPFYLGGHAIGLAPWVVQRGWQSALVVAAFLGVVRLSRLLGVSAFWPKVAAGLAYSLAPRMLSELGSISSELMPVAALPWVLIPLVQGAYGGSPRKAAARSGVALLFAGGVNAAATLAILPAPALWLLTRAPGRRRRALTAWWVLAVALACLWWAIPLVLLGRYSPPFLDWIEPSSVTTSVTNLLSVVRGVDHWEMYLGPGIWPAGWILVTVPAVILGTTLVAAGGIAGLSRRDLAHGLFLRSLLVLGVILLTLGHTGGVGPALSDQMRSLLDGPLNAFRNIHKFDPLVRLPLALGLGHLMARVRVPTVIRVRVGRRPVELAARPLAYAVVIMLGVLAAAPAITGRVMPSPRTTVEASWWVKTADWLAAHHGAGRALVVPGAPRPVYVWGSTVDDALQPVAQSPWAVRDGIPLGQAGYIRLLDSIEQRLTAGRTDAALAPLLVRAGIHYVVVRNDLNAGASGATPLSVVHATITTSPGFVGVASFGTDVGWPQTPTQVFDGGAGGQRPAVEIYQVAGDAAPVTLTSANGAVAATGSADELGDLIRRGLNPATPVIFGSDAAASGQYATVVATDGIRRRNANFGHATSASATLTANETSHGERAAQDYLPSDPGALSTMRYGGGLVDVTASSSGADAGALLDPSRAHGPWSAIDGSPDTAWESSSIAGAPGQWIQVTLSAPIQASTVQLQFAPNLGGYPTRLAIRTDAGELVADVEPSSRLQPVRIPTGSTQSLRVTVLAATSGTRAAGISTLSIAGLGPTRTLVVPITQTPDILAFDTDPGQRGECITADGRPACEPSFVAAGEEDDNLDRAFNLPSARTYAASATVRVRGGPDLDALLDAGRPVSAAATSEESADPRVRPGAAVDGDPATSWVAAAGDQVPGLTLALAAPTSVERIDLVDDPRAPVGRPEQVRVSAGNLVVTTAVPTDGAIVLPRAVRTSTIRIDVLRTALRRSNVLSSGVVRVQPVGIAEVRINGVQRPVSSAPISVGCGGGLTLTVDDTVIPLSVQASRRAVLNGDAVAARVCGDSTISLAAGSHHVSLPEAALARPDSLTFTHAGASLASERPGTLAVHAWGSNKRSLEVETTAAAILLVHENFNGGWRASFAGRELTAVQVDGWEQGWRVPAGVHGTVSLEFAPQTGFVAGLIAGVIAIVALITLGFVGRGRDEDPSAGEGRAVSWQVWTALSVAAVLLVGWPGAVIAIVLWRLAATLGRIRVALSFWLGGLLVAGAGCAEAVSRAASNSSVAGSSWVQLVVATAVLFASSRTGTDLPAAVLRPPKRRSSGRST